MKKLMISLMMVATIGISSASIAQTNPEQNSKFENEDSMKSMVYVRSETMKLDVFVEPSENENVMISIMDPEGRLIAKELINNKTESTGVRFDVASLQDGIYQVEISNGKDKKVNTVILKSEYQPQRSISLL